MVLTTRKQSFTLDVPPPKPWAHWWYGELGEIPAVVYTLHSKPLPVRSEKHEVALHVADQRRLTVEFYGGAVDPDGVLYFGFTTWIAADDDPLSAIRTRLAVPGLRLLKPRTGPLQPWEPDVDGFSPGRIAQRFMRPPKPGIWWRDVPKHAHTTTVEAQGRVIYVAYHVDEYTIAAFTLRRPVPGPAGERMYTASIRLPVGSSTTQALSHVQAVIDTWTEARLCWTASTTTRRKAKAGARGFDSGRSLIE